MKYISSLCLLFLSLHLSSQTGIPVSQLANCDDRVANFMATHQIPAAQLAIARNGKMVYNRAFGVTGGEATLPHHLFRVASVSKPITSIAIMKLVDDSELELSNRVFGDGGLLEDHPVLSQANITDNRIFDITVQNLLEHSAGWDRSTDCFPNPTSPYPYYFSGCDPIVAPLHVTQTNGTSNPVTEVDMITFLLEKGLDFTPNTSYAYSNIGFLVLGEIIEAVSGQNYEAYVQDQVLAPLGICDMHIGKTLLADKFEREVEYVGNGFTNLSCYGTGQQVPWEYGGFHLEAMSAHGGWIATASDLVRLLVAIDGFSSKPDILSSTAINTMTTPGGNSFFYAKGWSVNSANNWWHNGALDGTAALIVRTSGQFVWSFLLNKRVIGNSANQFWGDFDALPWECIGEVSSYPPHDLLEVPLTNSSNLTISEVAATTATLNWTNGDGTRRLVVAKADMSINNSPLDGNTYTANAVFSAGDDLGEQTYVVYDGEANSVEITGLQPATAYSFHVFDYHESATTGNHKLYKLCGGTTGQVTTSTATSTDDFAARGGLHLYPTLVNETLMIEWPAGLEIVRYQIYSAAGQLQSSGRLIGERAQLDVALLSSGLHLIRVESEGGKVAWKRFVKQ